MDTEFLSLCWDCNNYFCSWLQKKPTPVKGWTAERFDYELRNGKVVDTYTVIACPEFKRKELK